jgi:uncharacterized protein
MDVIELINKYYRPDSIAFSLLLQHSRLVAEKALQVALRVSGSSTYGPDLRFIEEASMLHDIGIFMTEAPLIGCSGNYPYIAHGYLGREILENEGLPEHALVCERHVGTGLTVADIEAGRLPIPRRPMTPVTLEEKIICFADKFYSKRKNNLHIEKPVPDIRKELFRYGESKLLQFDEWLLLFKEPM